MKHLVTGLLSLSLLRGPGRWLHTLRGVRPGWLMMAGTSVAAYQLTFFAAVARTGVAVGTLVMLATAPGAAGLAGWLLRGRRPSRLWAVATLVGLAGATLAPGYAVVAHLRRGRRLDVYDLWLIGVSSAMVKNTRFDPLLSLVHEQRHHDAEADDGGTDPVLPVPQLDRVDDRDRREQQHEREPHARHRELATRAGVELQLVGRREQAAAHAATLAARSSKAPIFSGHEMGGSGTESASAAPGERLEKKLMSTAFHAKALSI